MFDHEHALIMIILSSKIIRGLFITERLHLISQLVVVGATCVYMKYNWLPFMWLVARMYICFSVATQCITKPSLERAPCLQARHSCAVEPPPCRVSRMCNVCVRGVTISGMMAFYGLLYPAGTRDTYLQGCLVHFKHLFYVNTSLFETHNTIEKCTN